MTRVRAILVLLLLLTVCFTLATWLEPRASQLGAREQSADPLQILLGEGRRMFAKQFAVKADVYFHSGYYPSIFDEARKAADAEAGHMAEEHGGHDEEAHEKAMDFLGQPKDWIDRLSRNFYSSTHSHMDKPGDVKEILPWLRISAALDPHEVQTYLTASFWLRKTMGKPDEAEQFLREGLRANPNSFEILLELGRLYDENRHEPARARNLWELALRRWQEQEADHKDPDPNDEDKILATLEHLEEEQGNLPKALEYLEMELKVSPFAPIIQNRIDELKAKISATKGR
jgi:tetratricopeptide (TPR) repeat protein